jgi:hypothetical protein
MVLKNGGKNGAKKYLFPFCGFEWLAPKGPKAIFRPFLKFGQAIVKTIFIKNS